MTARVDVDRPAVTPEGRREQLAQELARVAERCGRALPLPYAPTLGLPLAARRAAQGVALVRLARRYPDVYRALVAEELAARSGGAR